MIQREFRGGSGSGGPLNVRLAATADALAARGLTVVRQLAHEDSFGDSTGSLAWLWVCCTPRRFAGEQFDLVATYSALDDAWSLSTPCGGYRQLPPGADVAEAATLLLEWPDAAIGADARAAPDWVWGILAGTATCTVVPFFQAIAGKAADDAYAALRAVLRKNPAGETPPEGDGDRLFFHDPEHDVRIVAPDPVPKDAIRQLCLMRPADVKGHVLVWDKEEQSWRRYRRQP